jgi:amino acid transporter
MTVGTSAREPQPVSGDKGLVRAMSAWGLAATIVSTVIGSGIFILPAKMSAQVGSIAPLLFLAAGLAVGAVGVCFAAGGSRVSIAGGVSGYVEATFGPYAGFVTAVLLWFGASFAAAGISVAVADSIGQVAPQFNAPIWRAGLIIAIQALLAGVNLVGVRAGSGLVGLMTVVKLAPLAVFLIVALPVLHPSVLGLKPPEHPAIGRAMILGVFAFMGMETALGVSGEVKRPERNVPLAIIASLSAIIILYILIQVSVESLLGPALATSKAPLADAMFRFSPALGGLLLAGQVLSMFGYLSSDSLSAPRILFGMARDGLLPRALARVAPATHAPAVAIVTHTVLVILIALSGAYVELAVLSTLVTVPAYIIGCLAAVVLQRRGVETQGPALMLKSLPLFAAVGVGAMVWLMCQGEVIEILGVALAILLATAIYLLARRPWRAKA